MPNMQGSYDIAIQMVLWQGSSVEFHKTVIWSTMKKDVVSIPNI